MILRCLPVGEMEANCYILACEKTRQGVVVDPGAEPEEVLRAVAEENISVREIVATHGHFDHIGWARDVQQALGAPFAIHREDLFLVHGLKDAAAFFGTTVGEPPEVDRLLADGDEVRFGEEFLRVLHTPGHSPGGITLVRDRVALVGDCLFAGSIGRTDLPGQSHEVLIASIQDRIMSLGDDTGIYPGHGPSTTVGEERRHNPFLKA